MSGRDSAAESGYTSALYHEVLGGVRVEVIGKVVLHQGAGHVDVHAAKRIDDVDESAQADPAVVVDRHVEARLHGLLFGGQAPVLGSRIDLIRDAGAGYGHVEVARYRHHVDLPAFGVEGDEDDGLRVGPGTRVHLQVVVAAEQQVVDATARADEGSDRRRLRRRRRDPHTRRSWRGPCRRRCQRRQVLAGLGRHDRGGVVPGTQAVRDRARQCGNRAKQEDPVHKVAQSAAPAGYLRSVATRIDRTNRRPSGRYRSTYPRPRGRVAIATRQPVFDPVALTPRQMVAGSAILLVAPGALYNPRTLVARDVSWHHACWPSPCAISGSCCCCAA